MSTQYYEGYHAFHNGWLNPYVEGTREYDDWQHGYSVAEGELAKQLKRFC